MLTHPPSPQVVRETYLPQSGCWLAEYPFIQRSLFLDISLRVEASRQGQGQGQQRGQQWTEQWREQA